MEAVMEKQRILSSPHLESELSKAFNVWQQPPLLVVLLVRL